VNLALFDFDGTITTHEMFRPFIEFAVSRRRRALGGALLAPLVAGYKAGWVSPNLMRAAAVRCGFAGVDEQEAFARGADFARDVLPSVLQGVAVERIQWHKQQGDRIAVVSGGLDVYLSHWCREHGLELLCSRLESRDGRLTGRYLGRQCVSAEKPRRVRESYRLDDYAVIYAYGDTREDWDLLSIAHRRYFQWREVA